MVEMLLFTWTLFFLFSDDNNDVEEARPSESIVKVFVPSFAFLLLVLMMTPPVTRFGSDVMT
jgi:hypothetical protein